MNGFAKYSGGPYNQLVFYNGEQDGGGLLSMINGHDGFNGSKTVYGFETYRGDLTIINGNFVAAGNSQLGVDAHLGGPGSGSASDLLVISNKGHYNEGRVTGQTGIVVNSDPQSPGASNLTGIPVVSVKSGLTDFDNFYIDPQSTNYAVKGGQGVIDKGLFFYAHDLVESPKDDGGLVHILVGLPDEEVFQAPVAITGAQNIWYETANGWQDKQNDLRGKQDSCDPVSGAGTDLPVKARPVVVCGPQSGYGVWVKGIGSWIRRNLDATATGTRYGSYTFDVGYKQDTYGVLGGIDWTRSGPGTTVQVGVMGGYVDSKLKFDSSSAPTTFDYKGGMVGVTATYINRGFFIDGLIKADFLSMDISMPSIAAFGTSAGSVDVTNIGGMGNIGYRWRINTKAYVEGIATLAYVSSKIDNVVLNGTTVQFQDGKSLRGAIGGRVGTTFVAAGNKVVDASILGRVWNEFEGDNAVTVVSGGPVLEIYDSGLHNKPFGEVIGIIDVANRGVGWSGFVNGGVKFNNDFTATTAKGGVRYQW